MMKRRLLALTATLAFTMCSTSVTAYASELTVIKEGNGYAILGALCPELPAETETPETPDVPESDNSNNSITDTPDVQEPETPSDYEEETMNTFATQVVDLVNQERAKAGLSQLTIDPSVTAAANVRAKEIKQSFSHTRPDGSSFSTALKEQSVSYKGSGENIAWGQKSPEQVMNAWMNSEGHRANILNSNYKNIGVGYYQDEKGRKYWVQLFTY